MKKYTKKRITFWWVSLHFADAQVVLIPIEQHLLLGALKNMAIRSDLGIAESRFKYGKPPQC
jgi:hypothetical protein